MRWNDKWERAHFNYKAQGYFFITLSVLKDPSTWDKIAVNFGMKGQKVQRIVGRAIDVLAPLVKREYVERSTRTNLNHSISVIAQTSHMFIMMRLKTRLEMKVIALLFVLNIYLMSY